MNKILEENQVRLNKLFTPYNPVTGVGSMTDRVPFKISSKHSKSLLIPATMADLYDIEKPLDQHKGDWTDVMAKFESRRLDHDFEYWTYSCISIKDKITALKIPFKQNFPQRILTAELEKQRVKNEPIRAIVTKARQWGGSTDVEFYMKWIQTRHKINWHSAIVADVESQAKNVRAMYANAIKDFPSDVQELSFKNFENQSSVKIIPERGCTVSIASMQQPDKLRSQDLKMCHASEVGLWKRTEGKQPKDVIQSLQGTIPSIPYTVFVEESTAKGVGNYFHQSWIKAINGETNKVPIFIPWYKIEIYQMLIETDEERLAIYSKLDDYGMFLWELGASLEGIKWYMHKLREFEGDTWRMNSEFPSTWEEAFSSTGQKAFSPKYINRLTPDVTDPKFIGDVHGADHIGPNAMKDAHFIDDVRGKFSLWRKPNDPPAPSGYIVKNRYEIIVDVGGKSESADYSAITVFDKYHMVTGGIPEAIATWHGKADADLIAWKAAQIGAYFTVGTVVPLLIIEVNFFDRKESDEGDAYYTTLDEIAPHYKNLFSRTPPDQIRAGRPIKYGFHMNRSTKPEIVRSYNKILREGLYIEYDTRLVGEAHSFENQGNGKYNAVDGSHDDLLVTRMIGVWNIYDNESAQPVSFVKIGGDTSVKVIDSPASFT